MTGPARYTRHTTQVEAMPLDRPQDLHLAEVWLRGHQLKVALSHPTLLSRGIMVLGPAGFVARLGQWIVHDLTTDTWSAVDDQLMRSPLFTPVLAEVLPLAARR